MRVYTIKFKQGDEVVGTASEVVEYLRRTSYFEKGLSNRQYRRNFATRHNRIYEKKVSSLTDTLFVESLTWSPTVESFKWTWK